MGGIECHCISMVMGQQAGDLAWRRRITPSLMFSWVLVWAMHRLSTSPYDTNITKRTSM